MEESTVTLTGNVEDILDKIKASLEELDTRKYDLINGDELFNFYTNMFSRIKDVKKQLE